MKEWGWPGAWCTIFAEAVTPGDTVTNPAIGFIDTATVVGEEQIMLVNTMGQPFVLHPKDIVTAHITNNV